MAAIVPIVVVCLALVGFCWFDIAGSEVQYLPKWAWALICLASIPLGPIAYLTIGRVPRPRSHPR